MYNSVFDSFNSFILQPLILSYPILYIIFVYLLTSFSPIHIFILIIFELLSLVSFEEELYIIFAGFKTFESFYSKISSFEGKLNLG